MRTREEMVAFCGQEQKYFLCRLHVEEPEYRLGYREFRAYKWRDLVGWLPEFKKKGKVSISSLFLFHIGIKYRRKIAFFNEFFSLSKVYGTIALIGVF